jgi:serine/threonine-protein kinase
MGAVYRAFDPVLEREVALKVMLPDLARDPEKRSRFEREARAVARLSHPFIVTLFDLGYHVDGSPYIVMELLKGLDLLRSLQAEPLPLRRRLEIVLQVLDGLGHAHRLGIVHRDIKPANVFIVEDGTARIMDFGIARFSATELTGCGTVLGTPSYMAPEQVLGQSVDGRADLWSVGALLCELLTGRRPFEGPTPVATMYRVVNDEPVIELPDDCGREVYLPVLRKALAKRPDDRFGDAAAFALALRLCLGEPELPAEARAAAVRLATAIGADDRTTRQVPQPSVPRKPTDTAPVTPAASAATGIFELLRAVHVGRRSGHLHFAVGRERKSLRILRGQIVLGSSDAQGEHLGDVLVRYGLLSQVERERAVAVVLRERKPLGLVLAEMKLLDRARLEQAVGLHVREILFSVLERPGVSFAFEEAAESSVDTDLRCPLSTGEVILEAARRMQDPEFVRRVLGDMDRVLAVASDPALAPKGMGLTPTDGFLLSRVDGTLSAREVVSLIPLPLEDTERSLFGLLCTGAVGYVDAERAGRAMGPQGGRPSRTLAGRRSSLVGA